MKKYLIACFILLGACSQNQLKLGENEFITSNGDAIRIQKEIGHKIFDDENEINSFIFYEVYINGKFISDKNIFLKTDYYKECLIRDIYFETYHELIVIIKTKDKNLDCKISPIKIEKYKVQNNQFVLIQN